MSLIGAGTQDKERFNKLSFLGEGESLTYIQKKAHGRNIYCSKYLIEK